MTCLVADIGGTYTRVAWIKGPATDDTGTAIYRNAEFAALEDVLARAIADHNAGGAVERMVLAVPGPVHSDPVRLTNIDWSLDRAALQQLFGVTQLTVVNDFQAAALGAINTPSAQLTVLNPGRPDSGPVVVAGAGTGLGMAWLPSAQDAALPHPTEGGHMDFAPADRDQADLLNWLAARYGHVSYERILSGPGLSDVHRYLTGDTASQPPADIVALARAGDSRALDAVRCLVDVFAAYAGNLALAFNPTGGIYLCGGLTAHLAGWFDPARFTAVFSAKGRMADLVRRIPVFLVARHDTGLAGAKLISKKVTGQTREQQQRAASSL